MKVLFIFIIEILFISFVINSQEIIIKEKKDNNLIINEYYLSINSKTLFLCSYEKGGDPVNSPNFEFSPQKKFLIIQINRGVYDVKDYRCKIIIFNVNDLKEILNKEDILGHYKCHIFWINEEKFWFIQNTGPGLNNWGICDLKLKNYLGWCAFQVYKTDKNKQILYVLDKNYLKESTIQRLRVIDLLNNKVLEDYNNIEFYDYTLDYNYFEIKFKNGKVKKITL